MNHDLYVLRALARLSRRGKAVDSESLAIRAGGSEEDVRDSLRRLERAALVDRSGVPFGMRATGKEVRITLAGLAVAVASSRAALKKSKGVARDARAMPARIEEEPVHARAESSSTSIVPQASQEASQESAGARRASRSHAA